MGLSDNIRNATEGGFAYIDPLEQPRISPFVKMVVMDVIFDPHNDATDELKKTSWIEMGVANVEWIDVLPRNTIIAKRVGETSLPLFVFPFFPSHLSLPCKPGEFVWAMFEEPDANLKSSGLKAYWFCRVNEPNVVDDVNHTHSPRIFEPTLSPGIEDIYSGNDSTVHELRNGPVILSNGERLTSYEKFALPGEDEDIFEQLVTKSDASKLMVYESIPRYRKRPGDITLEGSNNTLIVLGTDRSDSLASYSDPVTDEDSIRRTKVASYPTSQDFQDSAGSIDIVAGRGQTEGTYGTPADTTSLTGIPVKKELNKSLNESSGQEGDPDPYNDRSRILISQRTKTDSKFGIDQYNVNFSKPDVKDSDLGDSSIVIKSDKVRLIARSDVQIIVTDYTEESSPAGINVKRDKSSPDDWSSITIKRNGDIVFSPSRLGYIKLGSDDADKAILCTDQPALKSEGTVSFSPGLLTTGASVVGTGQSGQGTFAKKVLVK